MTRREVPLDAGRILEAFAAHAVEYTLIGGLLAAGSPCRAAARRAQGPLDVGSRPVTSLDTDAGGVDVHLAPPGGAI